ncbi:MAG: hypothetical protein NTZ92_07000 [Candidatus Omnitrophica bacterium]|nr:hypothetical protein [Candidatus Omnitrophota bacterium]
MDKRQPAFVVLEAVEREEKIRRMIWRRNIVLLKVSVLAQLNVNQRIKVKVKFIVQYFGQLDSLVMP